MANKRDIFLVFTVVFLLLALVVGVLHVLPEKTVIPVIDDEQLLANVLMIFHRPTGRQKKPKPRIFRVKKEVGAMKTAFNVSVEINGKVLDGHLQRGVFTFSEAKKACEDDGMFLPKKPFRFLNWEDINFGSLSGDKVFGKKAFWVEDDNKMYEEYEEARKIDYLVTLMKINQNDTHPLCAFLKPDSVDNGFHSSYICEDNPFDEFGRTVLNQGHPNEHKCPKMKLTSSFTDKYKLLDNSMLNKTWTIRMNNERNNVGVLRIFTGYKQDEFNSVNSGLPWCRGQPTYIQEGVFYREFDRKIIAARSHAQASLLCIK
ncbi:Oidioi.mRNA.OKI2018_I69.chr2.g4357.t1.cds [Oikopleura dioica]|uniref:Oidioi.mRNA.OKI2018_I69.chr2.g4357.t1.cds n=1 Tax=Oikopleura dioica TaxID=34765 RepID=A0ABN7T2J3_OIKDI|nr:Oidioi.mRNA.OKI2018_I69.chr2.g4357.t1.cds [Oikopleura dioica]